MRAKVIIKNIILVLMVVTVLISPTYKPAMAATKLSKEDFVASINSSTETLDFFTELDSTEADEGVRGFVYDKRYDESKKSVVKTSRGIYIGSKLSTVKKKYGSGTKGTLAKDVAYKKLLEISEDYKSYFSSTENVLTYKYVVKTEKGGVYTSRIHFYIDKNDKVVAVGFSRVFKN